jgi:hypothetical protein
MGICGGIVGFYMQGVVIYARGYALFRFGNSFSLVWGRLVITNCGGHFSNNQNLGVEQ